MTNLNRRMTSIANGQLGIVTRAQALAVGGSNRQLRSRVTSGTLDQVGHQTYQLPGAVKDAPARLSALLFDIDGEAVASGATAAALHGFDGYILRPPFDVTVRRGRNIARVGHRIHTTKQLDPIDRCVIGGAPSLSGARTLIDLARSSQASALVAAYDSGLRDGKYNETALHRRIVALGSSGRHGIPKLLDAINGFEHGRGGHSWLERRFLELIADAGLPRPDTQQTLTRANDRAVRVDFRFPGTNVVVEVLGFRYHRTPQQIARDASRMNALVADSYRVFQFTYRMVVDEPDRVCADVRTALS